jgi:CheY-like chemotaxis protein
MPRVRLIHSNASEAKTRAATLRDAGYDVAHQPLSQAGIRSLRQNPPAAIVIDLSRAPSLGRDVALGLRQAQSTRRVPLVFVGGERQKVADIKRLLPDAIYTPWSRIRTSLKRAIENPPKDPTIPGSVFAGYSGTPLPKKLGIKPGAVVALVGAPRGFEQTLGSLPEDVTLRRQTRGRRDLTIWFAKSRKDLTDRIDRIAKALGTGGLWIAWPKKTSDLASDLTQNDVRREGLAIGLVDFKICAIDDTWSGLKFVWRKSK